MRAALALLGALAISCGGAEEPAERSERRVVLGPESVFIVREERIEQGPILSGTLQAEERATIRAQLAGQVVSIGADEGERVERGELLARIESDSVRQAALSAESSLRTAEQAVETARRNAERAGELASAGAIAEQAQEAARLELADAEARLANAQAQLASAREQLDDTIIRAPLGGVVSERAVAAGEVVQPGTPLYTIVDLSTLLLEATVSSASLGTLELGDPVEFTVSGFEDTSFLGEVRRVSPVVDPETRQVTIFVSLPNPEGRLLGGLFAEGRLLSDARESLVVPASAVDGGESSPSVLRISSGEIERVPVDLGIRDERAELVEVRAGLLAGDRVLTGPARDILPGTPVLVSDEVEGSTASTEAPSPRPW